MITIFPDKINSFKNITLSNRNFVCILSSSLIKHINLGSSDYYQKCYISEFNEQTIEALFAQKETDFVVILNHNQQPRFNNKLAFDKQLDRSSRAIEIPLFSTAPTFDDLSQYIESLYITKPDDFDKKVDHFFSQLEKERIVYFKNPNYNTTLTYQCANTPNSERWLEVGGYTELGTKQVYPCGEIEVTPLPFDQSIEIEKQNTLNLSGDVIITGPNIVNAGYFPFTRKSQKNIFKQLATITQEKPIKLSISQGKIQQITSITTDEHPAVNFLNYLFSIEERYRIVSELGISYNNQLELMPGNQFYNELVDSSKNKTGSLHLGLGLLINTQYHFDLFALETELKHTQ
ncbi:hypothetical protein L3V83_01760 [Thiotrichales bacterium 19X7-9]|nr:hypothetical protein [Thiotrichales bacterium 19X7-9]